METLFDQTFHPDITVATAQMVMDRKRWKEVVRALVERHATVSDVEVKTSDGSHSSYRMALEIDGAASLDLSAVARLRNGLVAHVEPTDPTAYAELVEWTASTAPVQTTIGEKP